MNEIEKFKRALHACHYHIESEAEYLSSLKPEEQSILVGIYHLIRTEKEEDIIDTDDGFNMFAYTLNLEKLLDFSQSLVSDFDNTDKIIGVLKSIRKKKISVISNNETHYIHPLNINGIELERTAESEKYPFGSVEFFRTLIPIHCELYLYKPIFKSIQRHTKLNED